MFLGYVSNNKINGPAAYIQGNVDFYKGQFREDLRHGPGTLWFTNGEKYTGTFENNKKDGPGVYRW